jgi:hypothetical protein
VRNLILFGEQLLATLQAAPRPNSWTDTTRRFGTLNIALIIARITRGLRLAKALEQRVQRNAAGIDRAATAATPGTPPERRPANHTTGPKPPLRADDAALLARLPTAEEITALVRTRRIGEVIEAICHDLGLTAAHPLWRDMQAALNRHGGNFARFFITAMNRMIAPMQQAGNLPLTFVPAPRAATGPP